MPEPKGITGNNIEDLLRARAGAAPRGRVEWLPHADPDLRRVIDDGRLLVLIARNSGVSGKKSFLAAAQEAWDAAEDLKTTGGMDVTSLLPPVAALAEQLASTPFREQHRSRDGEVFPSRVVVVDQRRHGVVVVVTSSSAVKEDENLEQPHGKMVGWILRSLTPKVGAFFVKRVDRLSRTQLGFVPVFKELLGAEGSEIYLRPAEWYVQPGDDVSWATVVAGATQRNETAIGLKSALLAEPGLKFGVVVNPPKSQTYTIGPGDAVVVLAED